jgi:hypothetical protein
MVDISPGAAAGIGIGAGVGTVILLAFLGGVFKIPTAYAEGAPLYETSQYFSLINWFRILYYFLPYGLFLFGVIYDGLVRKIKFFPAGFIGLVAVYLNSLISYFVNGRVPVIDSDSCGIPGMSKSGSVIAPQNILFTTTVLSYIASYITNTQSDSAYSGAAWGGVGISALIGGAMYYRNNCYGDGTKWTLSFLGSVTPILYAVMGGMLIGGISGWQISSAIGDGGGIGLSSEQKQSLSTGKPAMAPTSGTSGAGKCSPTDSDDQFVCEAYKNGELVTSTIVE